jgi:hypothetical protein
VARRCWVVSENGSEEGLLVRAEPLGLAEELSRRMVEVRVVDGVLLHDADTAWAWAINTVLVKKGLRVSELRRVKDSQTTKGHLVNGAGRGTDPRGRGQ